MELSSRAFLRFTPADAKRGGRGATACLDLRSQDGDPKDGERKQSPHPHTY